MDVVSRHATHAAALGGPVLLAAGMLLLLHLTRPDRPIPQRRRWQHVMIAAVWAGAAVTHLTVIPHHLHESLILGWFFVLLSAMQLAYAVVAWIRLTPRLLAAGIVANACTVTLWTYTRTVNIPFGLGPRESVGVVDMIATGLEIIAIALSLNLLWTWRPRVSKGRGGNRWSSGTDPGPAVPYDEGSHHGFPLSGRASTTTVGTGRQNRRSEGV